MSRYLRHRRARLFWTTNPMKGLQQALLSSPVPAGFSGWWCQRCERPVHLPDEAGSPAKCPHCRKYTAVWVPPAADPMLAERPAEWVRQRPTADQAKMLFAQLRAAVEGGEAIPGTPGTERTET